MLRRLSLTMLLAAVPAVAQVPAGDAEAGRAVAERWCSQCHVASGTGTDAVPPLAAVANYRDDDSLRAFLVRPHGRMPDLSLSTREINDLIAYLRTLR